MNTTLPQTKMMRLAVIIREGAAFDPEGFREYPELTRGSVSFPWMDATRAGWSRMWEALCARWGSYDCRHAASGECWQYMGTGTGYSQAPDWPLHTFRHRMLPPRGERMYWYVPVEPGDYLPVPPPAARPAGALLATGLPPEEAGA